ncbi:MAG: ABC transporter ATP-binding protein [Mycobacteriaceae bacterium]
MLTQLLRTNLRSYKLHLVIIVLLQILGTLASLYLPSLNADIIDNGVAKGDTGYIISVGTVMLAISALQIICSIIAVYFGSKTAMGFGRQVRSAIFHQVGTFSAQEVSKFSAPSLLTRTTNDVQQVQMLVLLTLTLMVAAPIMCVGGIFMAIREDIGLSWLLLVCVPTLVLAISVVVWQMVPQFRLMQDRIDGVNRVLREQITGIRVVRAFVREDFERHRFNKANTDLTDTALQVGRLQALLFPVVMLVLNVSSVAVLWFGGLRIDEGQMEVGALTAFLSYLMQILMAVMMAAFMAVLIPRAAVCAERISEVLNTKSSVIPSAMPLSMDKANDAVRGTVELTKVSFSYPGADRSVLDNISLTAQPGKVTAIVGSTGSGKSTLLSLIPRLFDATSGSVLINGFDVKDIDPELLWPQIGLVPQKAYLFSGTIASNLRYGRSDASEEQMWQALEIAQAKDFVEALSDGLHSAVAQGGTNFSGGQRQRLAIARAIIRQPQIYLFDDSFSALDLSTDAKLRIALREVTQSSTVIIVAQRISTIIDADQILVFEDGKIVGSGTHDQLSQSCTTYSEIVDSQLPAGSVA